MIKIAFAGAHGTGKTTLLRELNRYLRFPERLSPARRVMSRMGACSVDELVRKGLGREFQETVARELIASHAAPGSFIADRSVFDAQGYDQALGLTRMDYAGEIKRAKLRYDLIIRLPVEFPAEADGVRRTSEAERLSIQEEIFLAVEESGMPYMTVSGSLDDRIDAVAGALMALFDGMKTRLTANGFRFISQGRGKLAVG